MTRRWQEKNSRSRKRFKRRFGEILKWNSSIEASTWVRKVLLHRVIARWKLHRHQMKPHPLRKWLDLNINYWDDVSLTQSHTEFWSLLLRLVRSSSTKGIERRNCTDTSKTLRKASSESSFSIASSVEGAFAWKSLLTDIFLLRLRPRQWEKMCSSLTSRESKMKSPRLGCDKRDHHDSRRVTSSEKRLKTARTENVAPRIWYLRDPPTVFGSNFPDSWMKLSRAHESLVRVDDQLARFGKTVNQNAIWINYTRFPTRV